MIFSGVPMLAHGRAIRGSRCFAHGFRRPLLSLTRSALLLLFVFSGILFSSCHGKKSLPAFSVPESFDSSRHIEISF